jgi:hypothetical protein
LTAIAIEFENLNFSSKLALAGDVGQRTLVSSRHSIEDLETVQCTSGFVEERERTTTIDWYQRGRSQYML